MMATNIRLTQLDGKMPNLALMKLAHWHRQQGHEVTLASTPSPSLFEPSGYDAVYGSAIFKWSGPDVDRLLDAYPAAMVGGTGTDETTTVETAIGADEYEHYDYSIYPEYPFSIGFTQRGCRLNCGFCVVPKKEGEPRAVNAIADIWREDCERSIVLLDNDFFGQPKDDWQARIDELNTGGFKVCFNQGINIRMVDPESAAALASVRYYDSKFIERRLYTAWDNIGQEKIFFRGVDELESAGVRPSHLMVYMLIGYKPGETMEEILYRHQLLTDRGCHPYPMVYNNEDRELKRFQRWSVRRLYKTVAWKDYDTRIRGTATIS